MDKILILYFCRALHYLLLKTTEFSLPHIFMAQKYVYKHTEKMLNTNESNTFLGVLLGLF